MDHAFLGYQKSGSHLHALCSQHHANKVKGAYAALLSDVYSAKRARLSNDANIACFGAFTIGNKLMEELALAFLENEFVPGCASQEKVDRFVAYDQARN